MFDQFVDAWLDAVEHWLWIDAGEHDGCDKHAEQQAFAASDFGECLVGFAWLAVEDALIGPQQIQGGENDAECGNNNPPTRGFKRTNKHQEFANEAVEARQTNGRQHDHHEEAGKNWGDRLDAAKLGDLACVSALVDHANHEEQCTSGNTVVDHLHDAARERLRCECEGAEHDEAKVGNG